MKITLFYIIALLSGTGKIVVGISVNVYIFIGISVDVYIFRAKYTTNDLYYYQMSVYSYAHKTRL